MKEKKNSRGEIIAALAGGSVGAAGAGMGKRIYEKYKG